MAIDNTADIATMIRLALESYAQKETEKVIENAKAQIEDVLRGALASVTLNVLKNYNVMRDERNIIITVKNDAAMTPAPSN